MAEVIIRAGQVWRRKSDGSPRVVVDCAYGDSAYGYARLRKVGGGALYSVSARGLRAKYELMEEPNLLVDGEENNR